MGKVISKVNEKVLEKQKLELLQKLLRIN